MRGGVATSVAGLLAAAALAVGLGACTTEGTQSTLPPVYVDVDALVGATIDVDVGAVIVATGTDRSTTDWTAEIADPSVVGFIPARAGRVRFAPELIALSPGRTEVTLRNEVTAQVAGFWIEVAPRPTPVPGE